MTVITDIHFKIMIKTFLSSVALLSCMFFSNNVQAQQATNPIIFADVPDMSMIRVGKNYYMASTTMHMTPGVPIMKSTDLVNWKLINYAYDTLADLPALNLEEGKNIYSRGSWASSLRYHKGMYYVTTFAHDIPGETYIFKTKDIEKGNWQRVSFKPSLHDNSLFFDDDGKVYLIYDADRLKIVELNELLGNHGRDRRNEKTKSRNIYCKIQ